MQEILFSVNDKTYVVSFSSPSGGIGTTLLSVNSAIQLAKKGHNVLLLDLALSKATCHLALGLSLPEKNLSLLSTSKGVDLKDCIVSTNVSNLSLISGQPDFLNVSNMPYLVKTKIISEMRNLAFDYIIIDAGSGTGNDSLDFTLSADFSTFVISPTPYSLEPFYRYIRALINRLLVLSLNKKRYQSLKSKIDFAYPLKGFTELEDTDENDIKEVESWLSKRRPGFIFTRSSEKDSRMGNQIESLIKRFFEIKVEFLGNIDWDTVSESGFLSMEPISKNYPICKFSLSIEKLVNRIIKLQKEEIDTFRRSSKKIITAYDILEINPNATVKEIQTAYQRKLEIFAENSFIPIGLLTKEEKEKERDILEQNYKLLINKEARKKYDEELITKKIISEEERVSDYKEIQGDFPQTQSIEEKETKEHIVEEEEGDISEVAFYDGPGLKKIRLLKKISIEEIVSETNIRTWYIESIEAERYDALPARIYLKGFLKQIAQYLKLSSEKVLKDYLEKYDNWASTTQKTI